MEKIEIEVVYGNAEKQSVIALSISEGSTMEEAILASGILDLWPEINIYEKAVGIFGKIVSLDKKLRAGDRVEIYRDLYLDPKTARRRRIKPSRIQHKNQSNGQSKPE